MPTGTVLFGIFFAIGDGPFWHNSFLYLDFKSVLPINLLIYLQNLCFPIVFTSGLDQIHLLVAVEGLK